MHLAPLIRSSAFLFSVSALVAANFPARDPDFQETIPVQARVAYPDRDSGGRLWLQGTAEFPVVRVMDGGKPIAELTLSAPDYVGSWLVPAKPLRVEFVGATGGHALNVDPKSRAQLLETTARHSVVFYGCFQPFTAHSDGTASLYPGHGGNGIDPAFFRFFGDLTQGRVLPQKGPALGEIRLVVGTGDQVYVDAGYEHNPPVDGKPHALSAWQTGQAKPTLRDPANYPAHLETMYREFYSFRALNELFRRVPQVNSWDDHDVRDGWGSHGDEYDANGQLSAEMREAYWLGRRAYVNQQILPGPRAGEAAKFRAENVPIHQVFQVGAIKGFAFDTRSNRRVGLNGEPSIVLGQAQKEAFEQWLNQTVKKDDMILLVSPMPLFLQNNWAATTVGAHGGTKDDINDGWENHAEERKWLLTLLLEARINRGVRVITVSGDYHKSALSEIWHYGQDGKRHVFGYEILATGVYHEGIAQGIFKRAFKRIEAQRVGQHRINVTLADGAGHTFEPYVKFSEVLPNFALLTVDGANALARVYVPEVNEDDSLSAVEYSLPFDWTKEYRQSDEAEQTLWQKILSKFVFGIYINVLRAEETDRHAIQRHHFKAVANP
jgi:hypothetical protein